MKKEISSRFILLSLSFTEGAAIMCLQLGGASLLSPYFGNTLQTWSVLIGVVFFGFLLGYLCKARKLFNDPGYPMLFSGAYLLLALHFSNSAVDLISLNQPWGMLLASLSFIGLPVFLLSTIPIIVTQKLAETSTVGQSAKAGFSNGLSFFVSTLGAIISSFAVGFFLIPTFGPHNVLSALGIFLFTFALPPVLINAAPRGKLLFLSMMVGVAVLLLFRDETPGLFNKKIIYSSHGVLGQVLVADDTVQHKRTLFINGSQQSQADLTDTSSAYGYVWEMIKRAETINKNASVLILGMGGGYLAHYFSKKGCTVDVVEMDRRIPEVAARYFLPSDFKAHVHIDDARHYLNTATTLEKYDLIVIDVYTGDNAPFHIITYEAFLKMHELLNTEGSLYVYFPYGLDADIQKAHSMMKQTMYATGFQPEEDQVTPGKTILFASKTRRVQEVPLNAEIFTDNKPQLELLLAHQHDVLNSLRKKLWQKR